jgi:hypothetical protein
MSQTMFIVLLVVALATVLVYVVFARLLPQRWRKSDVEASEDFAINSVNVLIGLLFSILLAFVIAGVLSDYDRASNNTQEEANSLGAIYGYAKGIPEPDLSRWRSDSRNYAALVVNEDWPLMQTQQASQKAWDAVNKLRDDIVAFQANTPLEQSLQEKAIDKVQNIYDTRRTRVDLIGAGVPDIMGYSLLGGAIMVALIPLLINPHPTARLLIAMGLQSMVLAASLYLVSELNHPFSGEFRVQPTAFEILISRFDAAR